MPVRSINQGPQTQKPKEAFQSLLEKEAKGDDENARRQLGIGKMDTRHRIWTRKTGR